MAVDVCSTVDVCPPVSSPQESVIDRFVRGACREDLESLAYATLRIAAEMRAARNWDGGADWLEAIHATTTEALANLLQPGSIPGHSGDETDPDDSDAVTFAWRRWLGGDAEAWFQTYDPAAPELWEGTFEGWEQAVDRAGLLREQVDGLDDDQRLVFLTAMGCGADDWHDADLSDADLMASAIAALQTARIGDL